MQENLAEIVVIMDASGSMDTLRDDTIGGFNSFIEEQKKLPGEAMVTLLQFNTSEFLVFSRTPLQKVPKLNKLMYIPSGSTALLDAVGRAIDGVGRNLSATTEEERPGKVVFVIITDGQENASHQFSKADIAKKIRHQENKYSWRFIYLGANQDAFAEAGGMGINQNFAMHYHSTPTGLGAAYVVAGAAVGTLRQARNVNDVQAVFDDEQRKKVEAAK